MSQSSLTTDGSEDLEGYVSDLLHTERGKVVLSQEVEGVGTEKLQHNADVGFVLEPVQHPHTGTTRREE